MWEILIDGLLQLALEFLFGTEIGRKILAILVILFAVVLAAAFVHKSFA
jgi:hypothetical protein